MTRTRQNRQRTASVTSISEPVEDLPLTRADFDAAIAVLEKLSEFFQELQAVPGQNHDYASMQNAINRLQLYRDWWTAPADPDSQTVPAPEILSPDRVAARIEELEEEVRSWRGYSRRNEDRAKKAQRELEHIKTTRRQR